jgi:tetratricopeptide (TPR) repeat protein
MCCRQRINKLIQVSSLVALFTASGLAQENMGGRTGVELPRQNDDATNRGSIRGRVVLPGDRFAPENLKVSLLSVRGVQAVVFTDARGGFDFTDLPPGNYEVQVETSGAEYQVVNQNVQVFRGMPAVITVAIAEKTTATAARAGTVSVAELGADIPKAARREFEAGNKAVENKKTQEAIVHFRQAVAIYPTFVMAHNNLGAQLLAQGKLDEAAEELRKAVELDQKAFNPKLNLGIVLVEQERFFEATLILDQAIALNPDSPAAQLYVGVARLKLENLDEAEKHLKAAYTLGGSSYSMALFHLGELYMNKGDREAALKSFQAYLRESPSASNAAIAQKLIATLH